MQPHLAAHVLGLSADEAGGSVDLGWAQGPLPTLLSVFLSVQERPGISSSSARSRKWARGAWFLGKEPHLLGREWGQARHSPIHRPGTPGSHTWAAEGKQGWRGQSSHLANIFVLRWLAGWPWGGGWEAMPQPQSHSPVRVYGSELGTLHGSQACLSHPTLDGDEAQVQKHSDAGQAGTHAPTPPPTLSRGEGQPAEEEEGRCSAP